MLDTLQLQPLLDQGIRFLEIYHPQNPESKEYWLLQRYDNSVSPETITVEGYNLTFWLKNNQITSNSINSLVNGDLYKPLLTRYSKNYCYKIISKI